MQAVMEELVRQGYPRMVYPEHPPIIDHDEEFTPKQSSEGYAGLAYTVGYARASLKAALRA